MNFKIESKIWVLIFLVFSFFNIDPIFTSDYYKGQDFDCERSNCLQEFTRLSRLEDISEKTMLFGTIRDSQIIPLQKVLLNNLGFIFPQPYPNEHKYSFINNNLYFYHDDGKTTSIFRFIRKKEDNFVIIGEFLLEPQVYQFLFFSDDFRYSADALNDMLGYFSKNAYSNYKKINNYFHSIGIIHLGQFEYAKNICMEIILGESDDLLYECLCWHYQMGVRHFELFSEKLSCSVQRKITLFHSRLLNSIELNIHKCSDVCLESSYDKDKWVLRITDRQFLCLTQPLPHLLLSIPAQVNGVEVFQYIYDRASDSESVEVKTYKTHNYRLNQPSSNNIRMSKYCDSPLDYFFLENVFIASFSDRKSYFVDVSNLVYSPLDVEEALVLSIYNACREKYFSSEYFCPEKQPYFDFYQKYREYSDKIGAGHISLGENYLYGCVHKNGSSNLYGFLNDLAINGKCSIFLNTDLYYGGLHKYFHASPENISISFSHSMFKFCFSRNPYARVLSAYLDKINTALDRAFYLDSLGLSCSGSVTLLCFLKSICLNYNEYNLKDLNEHFRPQYALTLSEVIPYDFIGKLENFTEDFSYIVRRLSPESKSSDYYYTSHATNAAAKLAQYYNPETEEGRECIRLVQEIYAKDFELYGYSLDVPTDNVTAAGRRLSSIPDRHLIADYAIDSVYDDAESLHVINATKLSALSVAVSDPLTNIIDPADHVDAPISSLTSTLMGEPALFSGAERSVVQSDQLSLSTPDAQSWALIPYVPMSDHGCLSASSVK